MWKTVNSNFLIIVSVYNTGVFFSAHLSYFSDQFVKAILISVVHFPSGSPEYSVSSPRAVFYLIVTFFFSKNLKGSCRQIIFLVDCSDHITHFYIFFTESLCPPCQIQAPKLPLCCQHYPAPFVPAFAPFLYLPHRINRPCLVYHPLTERSLRTTCILYSWDLSFISLFFKRVKSF